MMTADDAEDLIGLPYGEGSFGPNSYNCWGLLHYVQGQYFGVRMPKAPIGDAGRCHKMFRDHVTAGVWALTDSPTHGDGALLRGGNEPHVGVYLDFDGGGILHSMRGAGVIFTSVSELYKFGFSKVKYYRLKNDGDLNSS